MVCHRRGNNELLNCFKNSSWLSVFADNVEIRNYVLFLLYK